MFWRDDPRGIEAKQAIKPDWPRNGAVLRGQVHILISTTISQKSLNSITSYRI